MRILGGILLAISLFTTGCSGGGSSSPAPTPSTTPSPDPQPSPTSTPAPTPTPTPSASPTPTPTPTTEPTPDPTPTPTSTSTPISDRSDLPELLEVSFPKGAANSRVTQSFDIVDVSGNADLPENPSLSGPDAPYIRLLFPIPSSRYDNDLKVIIYTFRVHVENRVDFDFENPVDANRDNVYEMTLSADYLGKRESIDIQVTVTDVVE